MYYYSGLSKLAATTMPMLHVVALGFFGLLSSSTTIVPAHNVLYATKNVHFSSSMTFGLPSTDFDAF